MNLKRIVVLAAIMAFFASSPAWASLGVHSVDATNPCQKCHDTAKGTPTLRGWSGGSLPAFGVTGSWAGRTISSLCYMCHTSGGGGYTATNQSGNAYHTSAHGPTVGDLPYSPAMVAEPSLTTLTLPYARLGTNMECTTCHNVHKYEDKPFLQRSGANNVADLCALCHTARQNNTPLRGTANSVTGRSTHPTRIAVSAAGNTRIRIKTLADPGANPGVNVPYTTTGAYALGGHIIGGGTTGSMDCGTCHAVHGTRQGSAPVNDLLAIQNTTGSSGSALCVACHYGGVGDATYVGANGNDHPIDDNTVMAFYPTGVALPAEWTNQRSRNASAQKDPQPFFNTTTPACSSCHDMHGGLDTTALLQYGTTTTTFSYQTWCWVCHVASSINPNGHHSNQLNDSGFTSQIVCGDCHGAAGSDNWTAHNGFWGFGAYATSATDSAICEACHALNDPTFLNTAGLKGVAGTLTNPAIMPSSHGVYRTSNSQLDFGSSHQVDLAANGSNPNLVHKTTAWAGSGGSSEWGAGVNNPICESCHNILVNGGGTGSAGLYTGWQANLLLQNYQDDVNGIAGAGSAVGDELCRGCHVNVGSGDASFVHNPSAHTVITSAYTYPAAELPYGRSTSTVMTTGGCPGGTTADATGAPNNVSYPAANTVNCDSCHRPHNADIDSIDGNRYLILEVTNTGAWGTTICAECHNTDTQCQ